MRVPEMTAAGRACSRRAFSKIIEGGPVFDLGNGIFA
jgi:hypothetical protein